MAGPDPIISVIICTRNRGDRLGRTLESWTDIRSPVPWELMLVDNASTDDTAEVLKTFISATPHARYVYAPRPGLGAARDVASRAARGRIFAYTDDDCYPEADYLEAIAAAFSREPESVGLMGGRVLLFDPTDVEMAIETRDLPRLVPPRTYLETGTFHGANMVVRRSALEAAGGFDPELGAGTPFPCEDIDVAAAISWAGFYTRFEPRIVVQHHHGRKAVDLDKLWRGYDAGRGAYYAKYILRPDARAAYLKGWLSRAARHSGPWGIRQFTRELRFGAAYLVQRRKLGTLLLAAVPALVSLVAISSLATARGVLWKSRGLLRKEASGQVVARP